MATGRLVDAKEAFEAAEAEADRLGLLDEIVENESCFWGSGEGSEIDVEAARAVEGLDRARIEGWVNYG